MQNDNAKFKIICFVVFSSIFFLAVAGFLFAAVTPNSEETASKQKTLKFFVMQNTSDVTNGSQASSAFEIFIGESEPQIKSAKIEIEGIMASPAASPRIEVYIDSPSEAKTFSINSSADRFKLEYNITNYLSVINPIAKGSNNYTLYLTPFDFSASLLSAKVYITYKFTPPTTGTGYQSSGTLDSATFDTGIAQGAAYNSLLWKGSIQSGKVKFKLATSNSSSGPWSYYGPGCTTASSDMYDIATDSPASIGCASIHNNKRYFRYKVTICSASNCTSAGSTTPTIDDIIVNWSP